MGYTHELRNVVIESIILKLEVVRHDLSYGRMLQSLSDICTNNDNCRVDGFVYSLDVPQALSSTHILSFIFNYACECVCLSMCVCVYAYVCMFMWRPEVSLSWHASSAAPVSFEKGFRLLALSCQLPD